MLYRLIVLSGPLSGQQLTVQRPSMTIGSEPHCSIHVHDDEMASKHALLEHDETGLLIRDLGTMQKILVNHHQVEKCRLKHGDEIEIGRTRFLVQATVSAEVEPSKTVPVAQRKKRWGSPAAWILLIASIVFIYYIGRRIQPSRNGPDEGKLISPAAVTGITAAADLPVLPLVIQTNLPTPTNVALDIQPETINPVPPVSSNADVALPEEGTNATDSNTTMPQTQKTPEPIPADPGPVKTNRIMTSQIAIPPSSPIIRIVAVEQNKFPVTEAYEEMRTLTIKLQQAATADIALNSVTMEVRFFDILFDKSSEKGEIVPSTMIVPKNPMKIAGPWSPGEQKVVTAAYTVPNMNVSPGKRRPQFYGFSIRVFHADVLQDKTCKPADLRVFMPE